MTEFSAKLVWKREGVLKTSKIQEGVLAILLWPTLGQTIYLLIVRFIKLKHTINLLKSMKTCRNSHLMKNFHQKWLISTKCRQKFKGWWHEITPKLRGGNDMTQSSRRRYLGYKRHLWRSLTCTGIIKPGVNKLGRFRGV